MERAAENLEFEKAAKLRDRISAIKSFGQKQHIVASKIKNQDVIAFETVPGNSCFEVFRFSDGKLYDREEFLFDALPDRSDFIVQYYSMQREIPKQITADFMPEDRELLEKWLGEKSGKTVCIHVPQKGEQLGLCEMCKKNARERLVMLSGKSGRQKAVLDELAKLCGLEKTPEYIESYDISHTAGQDMVASMVVFADGRPLKRDYRRFQIRTLDHADDLRALEEVLERRFRRYLDGDEHFAPLPDLLLMDGGQLQAESACRVLERLGLTVPVLGMVKDDRHRTRALVTAEGQELGIQQSPPLFALVGQIQEEVHRFAITYHHEKHAKSALTSRLDGIPGVGDVRKKALLKHFKSVRAIAQAELPQLEAVVPKAAARAVYDHFHKEDTP